MSCWRHGSGGYAVQEGGSVSVPMERILTDRRSSRAWVLRAPRLGWAAHGWARGPRVAERRLGQAHRARGWCRHPTTGPSTSSSRVPSQLSLQFLQIMHLWSHFICIMVFTSKAKFIFSWSQSPIGIWVYGLGLSFCWNSIDSPLSPIFLACSSFSFSLL